jgi:LmbE family N-acetylglucosaminyl deacetylase
VKLLQLDCRAHFVRLCQRRTGAIIEHKEIMKKTNQLSDLSIDQTSRVLVAMPHPDDEAVFISGLIHKLISSNIPTRILTMTRGEASTLRYGLSAGENLATARIKEQEQAFRTLGVCDYQILDFPDGGLEKYKTKVISRLKKEIKSFKPTLIVTLEPDGIYGHPDHIALSGYVTSLASRKHSVLYATLAPNYLLPRAVHMARKKTIRPIKPEFQLKLSLSDMIAKLKTMAAHRSQLHPFQHPSSYLFFLRNQLLTSEFFAYAELK